MTEQAKCRSCKQPIRWAITEKNARRIPLDLEPADDGNIVETGATDPSTGAPIVRYLKKSEGVTWPTMALVLGGQEPEPQARYVSHFATCPNADQHRKKK